MNVHVSFSHLGYSLKIKHSEKLKRAIPSPFHGRNRKYCSSDESHPSQFSGLTNKFKNWQHLRRNKLTASTFGRAVGFWPHGRVQLWREKIGLIEPFAGNFATSWGNIKEPEAIEQYELITENKLIHPQFSVNRHDEWLAASSDGIVDNYIYVQASPDDGIVENFTCGLPFRGIVEIKCPYFNGDKNKHIPWKRIPMYYIPQAQGLMEILDRDWMDMCCWTLNGSSLFRLYRDAEYWDLMKIALSDFWWKHVQPANEFVQHINGHKSSSRIRIVQASA